MLSQRASLNTVKAHVSPQRRPRVALAAAPVRNGILAALLATEYKRLLPRLEHVNLKCGETVYRADQEIGEVYLLEDAVIAMVDTTKDRRTVEVGIIGREGIAGINIFLGGVATPDKAIVMLPGGAMKMKSKDLRGEMRFGSPLQRLLLRYTQPFLAVISQSVACSQHHSVEQRLARWLLTMNDYAGPGEFPMPQDSVSAMLGVRRVGITAAAANLRKRGLIAYPRGNIQLLDTAGLEDAACGCYAVVRHMYRRSYRTKACRLPK